MRNRTIGHAAVFLALAVVADVARAAASAESVERLMAAMKVEKQLDAIYSQTLPAMQNAMRQSLGQQASSADADRLFDAVMPRVTALIREELGWAKLKGDFTTIYTETFTQEEIDGLIAFYRGPVGSAFIDKQPRLTARSMQMMQQRMIPVMQKAMRIAKEETEKQRPKGAKPR
ncbi:MAG: DUF2059 domain-containing protein [Caldimonas sp.]